MTVACACEHCGHEFEAEPEGGHRLLCGDSTAVKDVDRSLSGKAAAQTASPVVVLTPGSVNQRLYPEPTWTMAWFTPAGVGSGPWGFCCWQPILCFGRDPRLSRGEGRHPDAIVHTESAEKHGHPCAKPIKFWRWLVERTSRIGDLIYEPFSGSGTTIIAAEMTARVCRAIEISPAYCDVAVKRWSKFTGLAAVLADDGRTFDEVAKARGVPA